MKGSSFYASLIGAGSEPVREEKSLSFYRDRSSSDREELNLACRLKEAPHVLLVDDDPVYGRIMQRVASQNSVFLTYISTVEEFPKDQDFDVAVIDYDLGSVTGFEMAHYLESLSNIDIPVILVSQSEQKETKQWPTMIREFVHKDLGPYAVLEAVFEAFDISKIHEKIDKKVSDQH
ncbi:MAG: response regulator [Oligoflexales bacterium]